MLLRKVSRLSLLLTLYKYELTYRQVNKRELLAVIVPRIVIPFDVGLHLINNWVLQKGGGRE